MSMKLSNIKQHFGKVGTVFLLSVSHNFTSASGSTEYSTVLYILFVIITERVTSIDPAVIG